DTTLDKAAHEYKRKEHNRKVDARRAKLKKVGRSAGKVWKYLGETKLAQQSSGGSKKKTTQKKKRSSSGKAKYVIRGGVAYKVAGSGKKRKRSSGKKKPKSKTRKKSSGGSYGFENKNNWF
ncbi:unnamed protein product, partial [marine sediment metagenome]